MKRVKNILKGFPFQFEIMKYNDGHFEAFLALSNILLFDIFCDRIKTLILSLGLLQRIQFLQKINFQNENWRRARSQLSIANKI